VEANQGIGQLRCDLVVDCLLGTGLSRPVTGLFASLIHTINAQPAPVLSCDIPSGVNADTGQIMGVAVRADRTVMMALAKQASVLQPGCEFFGEVTLCEILPPEIVTWAASVDEIR
jgi:NAD(P)H-hydrate epimerase